MQVRSLRAPVCACSFILAMLGFAIGAAGQSAPLSHADVAVDVDSGVVFSPGEGGGGAGGAEIVFSHLLHVPDAPWMRLRFDEVMLGGSLEQGTGSFLRLTSLRDGAVQVLDAVSIEQWRKTSAYLNGDTVLVELLAYPADEPGIVANRVAIGVVHVGQSEGDSASAICDGVDDRELSYAAPDARLLPGGCTGWLFNNRHHCLLTAGHCASSTEVVEFNVPPAASNGGWVFAHPDNQYPVDPTSKQTSNNPCTNDYSYFGAFANSNTGLTPLQAQGESYTLAESMPAMSGQEIQIRGYGTTLAPVPPTWNRVQKVHSGPLVLISGTSVRYRVDTTGGNSGSAIFDMSLGMAIGIHTCGGCNATGGSNVGTAIMHTGLQNALANPQGVCAWVVRECTGDLNTDGVVNVTDLLDLLAAWGACAECPQDLTGDGVVNVTDLLELLAAWGECG